MSFVGKMWKVLVGIKDGLVLLFMVLFFLALFGILSSRPSPGAVRDGALLIELSGRVVEEKSALDPIEALLSGAVPVEEYRARDLIRALDAAASDERITAVVIDMTTFLGGGQVHLTEIGEAMDRVRKAKKPVLTYALGYGDDHMLLAAHASEVWLDPQGAALITGPGGTNLYFADLLQKVGDIGGMQGLGQLLQAQRIAHFESCKGARLAAIGRCIQRAFAPLVAQAQREFFTRLAIDARARKPDVLQRIKIS